MVIWTVTCTCLVEFGAGAGGGGDLRCIRDSPVVGAAGPRAILQYLLVVLTSADQCLVLTVSFHHVDHQHMAMGCYTNV